MTEADWLNCTDLDAMLRYLSIRISDRKLRLFACACCRQVSNWIHSEEVLSALEVAERFADNLATNEERSQARKIVQQRSENRELTRQPTRPKRERRAISTVYYALASEAMEAAENSSQLVRQAFVWDASQEGLPQPDLFINYRQKILKIQTSLLREMVGYPLQSIPIDPHWLSFNNNTVKQIAEGIYEERDFDRLPILHDALFDAGCANEDILSHCQSTEPHVRGCWVIDLLLGKE